LGDLFNVSLVVYMLFSTFPQMRRFNVTGLCFPDQDYMVDISNKVSQIMVMVERGDYFTINRARQYGKTTTIRQLEKTLLEKGYLVARISFEGVGDTPFENENNFCLNLLRQISEAFDMHNIKGYRLWRDRTITSFDKLDVFLNKMCKDKKVVLIIDETDKTSNNLVFLRFIGMLRDKYLERKNPKKATFQSVILAGVYDIKNLKVKLVKSGHYQLKDSEKRINSPWNIAADFEIDMSFSASEIITMLNEYEKDHKTGMDTEAVSREIRAYTNGYPYLVSRACKIIDETLEKDWTVRGVQKAVKKMTMERTVLIDDMAQNVQTYPELRDLMYNIVVKGETFTFNSMDSAMELGLLFGFLRKENEFIHVNNKIFETVLYEYFIHKERMSGKGVRGELVHNIVEKGKFNMPLAIKKFMQHYYELYHANRASFLEDECRLLFLTFLQPLINGSGFYHIEPETRNRQRMDVIVDYNSEQFIIELKIWHGEQKHEKAHEQLIEYLNSKNRSEGYLLTFDFRKRRARKPSAKWVRKSRKKFLDCLAV